MSTKPNMAGLAGAHTAGIYADMTVDGPEVGDLVVILDKAKNLPNRKTIGKQDPYCAARLGKEAKKTETDKRGGQTPRWDQELRFTVHDSPDYRQLKVSVFNDDRKTELIGESWVNLEGVLQRGGGRSDGWHVLQCKGRYAGEVRIELTYYDTRPKEDHPAKDLARDSGKTRHGHGPRDGQSSGDGLSRPRQPQSISRRPLPANPGSQSPPVVTTSAYPPPLRQARSRGEMNSSPRPAHSSASSTDPPSRPHLSPHSRKSVETHACREPAFEAERDPRYSPQDDPSSAYGPPLEDQGPRHFQGGRATPQPSHSPEHFTVSHGYGGSSPRHAYHPPGGPENEPIGSTAMRQGSPAAQVSPSTSGRADQHAQPPPPMRHHRSAPDHRHHQPIHTAPYPTQDEWGGFYLGVPPPAPGLRRHTQDGGYQSYPQGSYEDDLNEIPPPPPAHRFINPETSHPPTSHLSRDHVQASFGTGPPSMASHPVGVPYQSTEPRRMQRNPHTVSPSSTGEVPPVRPGQPGPSHSSNDSLVQSSPNGTVRHTYLNHRQSMPLSLVPGHHTGTAGDDPARMREHSGDDDTRWEGSVTSTTRATAPPLHRHHDSQLESRDTGSVRFDRFDAKHTSGGSAPVGQPAVASPEPLRIARKSVSPQPVTPSEGRRTSAMPFSPDSYEAIHHHPGSIGSHGGAQYDTPQGAEESSRRHQFSSPDEPIIGSDGRVIDPSDHIPAQNWAPEPEKKASVKSVTPVNGRSRPVPHGAQPMPPAARRTPRDSISRPPSTSTSSHRYGKEAPTTPESGRRVRLPKKDRDQTSPSVGQSGRPGTSYGGSTHSTPRSFQHASSTDRAVLDQSEEYGRGGSPSYASYGHDAMAHSPAVGGPPPPIPAKVPVSDHHHLPDDDLALSEELRTIDIGSSGRRMARRSQY